MRFVMRDVHVNSSGVSKAQTQYFLPFADFAPYLRVNVSHSDM